jgi:hypothetical protein
MAITGAVDRPTRKFESKSHSVKISKLKFSLNQKYNISEMHPCFLPRIQLRREPMAETISSRARSRSVPPLCPRRAQPQLRARPVQRRRSLTHIRSLWPAIRTRPFLPRIGGMIDKISVQKVRLQSKWIRRSPSCRDTFLNQGQPLAFDAVALAPLKRMPQFSMISSIYREDPIDTDHFRICYIFHIRGSLYSHEHSSFAGDRCRGNAARPGPLCDAASGRRSCSTGTSRLGSIPRTRAPL